MDVQEVTKIEQAPEYDSDYGDQVPGGALIDKDNGWTTLGTAAYSNSLGSYGWVTAAHNVGFSTGVPVGQPYDTDLYPSDKIGSSAGAVFGSLNDGVEKDAAFIEHDDPPSPVYQIANNSGGYKNFAIFGAVSENKLYDLSADNATVYFQGADSGDAQSTIKSLSGYDSGIRDATNVDLEYEDCVNGDSGGPYYWKKNSDDAYMVGIHAWGRNSNKNNGDPVDKAEGNAMWKIESALGLTV